MLRWLVERGVFVVEIDIGHLEPPAPLGLAPQTVLGRPLRVLLTEVDVDRFAVASLDKRVQAHRLEPYSAIRGEAIVSRSRHRCFGGRAEARRELMQRAQPR